MYGEEHFGVRKPGLRLGKLAATLRAKHGFAGKSGSMAPALQEGSPRWSLAPFSQLELCRWHDQLLSQPFDFSFDPLRITRNRADHDLMGPGVAVLLDDV